MMHVWMRRGVTPLVTLASLLIWTSSAYAEVTAMSSTVVINEDESASIQLLATSLNEDDDFTYTIVPCSELSTSPTHGMISGNPTQGSIQYVPDPDYNGPDEICFTARGTVSGNTSSPARISIQINRVNDAPVVNPMTVTVERDPLNPTTVDITLSGSDVDGDFLDFKIETDPDPSLGSLSVAAGGTITTFPAVVTYTAKAGIGTETDTFTFSANDGALTSDIQTVTVIIGSGNQQPTAADITLTIDEDATASVDISTDDPEGTATLSYEIVKQPQFGRLNGQAPSFTYIPNPNFSGTDTIQWKAREQNTAEQLESPVYTATIVVNPINDVPFFVTPTPEEATRINASEGVPLSVQITAADPDGDTLTYSMTGTPAGASFDAATGLFTWTPSPADARQVFNVTANVTDGSTDEQGMPTRVSRPFEIAVLRVDTDGDGIPDPVEIQFELSPTRADTDGDGISDGIEFGLDLTNPLNTDNTDNIDALDQDSDNDGIPDSVEAGTGGDINKAPLDSDADGKPDYRDDDSDNDGVLDAMDNCKVNSNGNQLDTDNDGVGDACDDDIDGDTVPNGQDLCPTIAGDVGRGGCVPPPAAPPKEEGCTTTGAAPAPDAPTGVALLLGGLLLGWRRRRA